MMHQCRQSFYWPGIAKDIRNYVSTVQPRSLVQSIQAGHPMQILPLTSQDHLQRVMQWMDAFNCNS